MSLLIGALTIGLLLALLALGVYISFRVFNFPDITADGSFPLGAAIAAVLIVHDISPGVATLVGALGGGVAGVLTGLLHTRMKINGLLAGILVMTALYSVNLHVMGRSNVPLLETATLATQAEDAAARWLGLGERLSVAGWELGRRDVAVLLASALLAAVVALALYLFFRTRLGTAMRATGDSPQMVRALGVNTDLMIIAGLALSNALIAASGALLAQYQGFADVQMGIGMVIWGLASVIIGEALVRGSQLGLALVGVLIGSVFFRELVAIALRWGLNPNDLKLITALFVLAALGLPRLLDRVRARRAGAVAHA